jgi:hypothetical protein
MPRTWLSVRVDLVSGRGEDLWPRPGRLFAAARAMTFGQFAAAIDDAFGRWDLAHLHTVELTDGTLLIGPGDNWDDPPQAVRSSAATGRSCPAWPWASSSPTPSTSATTGPICARSAISSSIRTRRSGGAGPAGGVLGWGSLPDQYGRRFDEDDGETPVPSDPRGSDLPAIRYDWGPRPRA